jgi:hypothetical protein
VHFQFFFNAFSFPSVVRERAERKPKNKKNNGKAKADSELPTPTSPDQHQAYSFDYFGDGSDYDDASHYYQTEAGPSNCQGAMEVVNDNSNVDEPHSQNGDPLSLDFDPEFEDSSRSSTSSRSSLVSMNLDNPGEERDHNGSGGSSDSSSSDSSRDLRNSGDGSDDSGSESMSEESGKKSPDDDSDDDDDEDGSMRLSGGLFRSFKLDQPVYERSRLSLKQYLLRLLHNSAKGKISLTSLEEQLRFQSSQGLPEGNRLPETNYQLFKLLGIDIDSFERHACVGGCEAFPPLDPSEYLQHADEKCKICKEPRFEKHGNVISPPMTSDKRRRPLTIVSGVPNLRRSFLTRMECWITSPRSSFSPLGLMVSGASRMATILSGHSESSSGICTEKTELARNTSCLPLWSLAPHRLPNLTPSFLPCLKKSGSLKQVYSSLSPLFSHQL